MQHTCVVTLSLISLLSHFTSGRPQLNQMPLPCPLDYPPPSSWLAHPPPAGVNSPVPFGGAGQPPPCPQLSLDPADLISQLLSLPTSTNVPFLSGEFNYNPRAMCL